MAEKSENFHDKMNLVRLPFSLSFPNDSVIRFIGDNIRFQISI